MDKRSSQMNVLKEIMDLMDKRVASRGNPKENPTDPNHPSVPKEGMPGHEEMEPEMDKEEEVKKLLDTLSSEELDMVRKHLAGKE